MDAKRVITVDEKIKIIKLKVKNGTMVYDGRILLIYEPITEGTDEESGKQKQKKLLKSTEAGIIRKILVKENQTVSPGSEIIELEKECNHPTVIKDLCAECGADLQKENEKEGVIPSQASVSMIHMIPELKVNPELAHILGKADMNRLLEQRKLVLLVDLDQTLIHTTNDDIPNNIKDVYHFQLYGRGSPWYHTRLRPGTHNFLRGISEKYELHICTFGSRRYAHTIARFLDEDGEIFSHRILSRDECFDPNSKTANLKALFPCGENMVCIIDDREDVWEYASNLIHVKPYRFFQHTGDIHAPPGLTKCENDDNKVGFDFTQLEKNSSSTVEDSNKEEDGSIEKTTEKDERGADQEERCDNNSDKSENERKPNKPLDSGTSQPEESSSDCDTNTTVDNHETDQQKLQEKAVVDESKFNDPPAEDISVAPTILEAVVDESQLNDPPVEDSSVVPISDDSLEKKEVNISNKNETVQNTNDNIDDKMEIENPVDKAIVKVANESSEEAEIDKPDGDVTVQSVNNVPEKEEPAKPNVDTVTQDADSNIEKKNEESGKSNSSVGTRSESKSVHHLSAPKLDNDGLIIIEETDDYLLYLEEILKIIHRKFFKQYKETGVIPDLKQVIPETRATVLKGVKIVFSSIVPNHVQLENSQAYKIARSLGAIVTQNIEPDSTHLVALRAGTAKVHAASRRKNLKLVTPEWLWTCAERWEKVDERLFPLQDSQMNTESRYPPAHCRSPDRVELPSPFVFHANKEVQPPQDSGFLLSINPLMSLSSEDIESMEGEVEDIFKESDDENEIDKAASNTLEQQSITVGKKRRNEDNSSSSSSDLRNSDDEDFESTKKERIKRKRFKYDHEYSPASLKITDDEMEGIDDEENEEDSDNETINDKFRRGEGLPSDLDMEYNSEEGSEEDQASDGEWNVMGAALEREFLED